MKKLLLTLLMLGSALGFSQAITVSNSTHTVPQLVNDVLINSSCVEASNISFRTGTNFGSVNGIGYFQNTNPNFPMQSGVILSTGNAQNAVGPNSTHLSDGSSAWSGDSDLEATLAQSGIDMVSANATVLEFDFVPISSNFSFDFVFASEEYGNFQCRFSDAFAFLLTNQNTGVTTNLALVPGTTTPISVINIRNFLYNSNCPSENEQYFGTYNGGTAAAGSATNFNGQTVVMNASSILVPNTPYHIKLVIADRSDYESDSAIFISSNSFNIGQDVLGQDITLVSGNAPCYGTTQTLHTGLDPSRYTFTWTRNGVRINGAVGASLSINQAGTYAVTYTDTTTSCDPITDSVVVQYQPQFLTPSPIDIYKCDSGATSYTFDLAVNTPHVSQGISPTPAVSYFASESDANDNVSPLSLTYNASANTTIYVRIQKADSQCYTVKSFKLLVTPPAVATRPNDMIACARSATANNANFNLTLQNAAILNGLSATMNIVTYYTTDINAANGQNSIPTPTAVLLTTQTIYVRVQNASDPDCFSLTSFNVTVNPLPLVDTFQNVTVCEFYILPPLTNGNYFTGQNGTGTPLFAGDHIDSTMFIYIYNQPGGPPNCANSSRFKVTIIDPLDLAPDDVTYCDSYTLPTLAFGKYRTAPGNGGTVVAPGTVISSTQTLYYYYVTTSEPYCVVDTSFTVTILTSPNVGTFANVFDCVSYTLPPLAVGNYFTQPNGQGSQLAPGTVLTNSQTVYVFAAGSDETVCTDEDPFNVIIGVTMPNDIVQCNPYVLPALAVGSYYTGPNGTGTRINQGTRIGQSTTIHIYISTNDCAGNISFNITITQPPVDTLSDVQSCETYTLPPLTNGNYYTATRAGGTMLQAGDVITETQTIFIYNSVVAGCHSETKFKVTINPLPEIDSRPSIDACDSYLLTNLAVGKYYTGPGGTGTMLPGGTVLTSSQTVYIYGTNSAGCSSESSFDIFIFSVLADAPAPVTVCDSYTLPPLTNGNYYTQSGGTGTMLHAGKVFTESATLYVYIEAQERALTCNNENIFQITINHTPVIPTTNDVKVCNSYTLPALTVGNYFTAANGRGTQLPAGTVLTTSQTVYIYAETATLPNCTDAESFEVTIFNVDDLNDVVTCESYVLPTLTIGKYYTGQGGTGTQLNAGTVITSSKTIYIYAQSPFTPLCFDESEFEITIIPKPIANAVPIAIATVCDEDGTNDGNTAFDVTTLTSTVLGSQSGAEFIVTYYENSANANTDTNPITATRLPLVYVRVSNTLAPDCFDVRSIAIKVNKLPEPTPKDGIICFVTETQQATNTYTIQSGLNANTHTFEWKDERGMVVGTGSNYTANLPGVYTVVATNRATGCSSVPTPAVVSPSEPAIVTYTITEDFANTQSITVVAVGTGDYVYQLDFGPYQSSPIFNDVSTGIHNITVKDLNLCGETTVEALVVNYPRFFTPNGDGVNETWNIKDLEKETNAVIDIFDRYGKMLCQIKPQGAGWNGTFNGSALPSSDYWFVVKYEKDGQSKQFRSHFSMKR